jgi:chaperonin GroES
MKFKPMHDRVAIKLQNAEGRSAGGIVIPDNAQEKPNTGTVVAVGPGRLTPEGALVSMTVTPGNTVMFGKHAGHAVKVDGEELVVLREEEIFAIVE